MKQGVSILVAAGLLGLLAWRYLGMSPGPPGEVTGPGESPTGSTTGRAFLDISVHSIEELEILFDRAEALAAQPRPAGHEDSIVLVLHGPEVEFFAIPNYARYRVIVDRAARLDAFDVVDVKICQIMMRNYGIAPDEIPAFIEQVPDGGLEIERLTRDGYVYF